MNDQITILKEYQAKHPKCHGHNTLDCFRIIEDLEENPAVAMTRMCLTKCRWDKRGAGSSCPPGKKDENV